MSKTKVVKNTKTEGKTLSKGELKEIYSQMLLMRRFEEKSGQLYGMGLIGGFCHLYIGQEAVLAGVSKLKIKGDSMITSYRCHAHTIASGIEPKYVLAELMGRETGCSKGKGGSMHMFDTACNFYGGHGIVGAQVPLGTGIAFAAKYKETNNVCFTFFGDGALHQGQVYEAFNMAKLWNLPVIYIIENNEYSMGTSVKRSTAMTDLYKRGESFGIPGKRINGMDVFSVLEGVEEALDYVRSGNGPILLEMKTYRYRGHSMSDPAKYRSKEEVNEYKEKLDPIDNLKHHMISNKLFKEEDFDKMEQEVKAIVNDAVEFSKNSSEPSVSELFTDIYSE